jgi:hypothetical protein
MGKISGSGSGMSNPGHISESLETVFSWVKILKFFDADPGREKFGSGINIPDPQHCLQRLTGSVTTKAGTTHLMRVKNNRIFLL